MEKLEELSFHDNVVLNITFESRKDFLDRISITILDDIYDNKIYLIRCDECARVMFNNEGWIFGIDTILLLSIKKGEELDEELSDFSPETRKQLSQLCLEFNSSGAVLKVTAKNIYIHETRDIE